MTDVLSTLDNVNAQLASLIVSLAETDGGTVALNGQPVPETGFVVGGWVPSLIVNIDSDYREKVRDFITIHYAKLRMPGFYLGAWVNESDVYFDVTFIFSDRDTAITTGKMLGEIAIWDLTEGNAITL